MEIPELAELIWLFEDQPTAEHDDLAWPVGLQSFRLRRGDREVLFTLDPISGEAYLTLYAAGEEISSIGRLRRLEGLTIERPDDRQGLTLRFEGDYLDPIHLETWPTIRLSWDVRPLGAW